MSHVKVQATLERDSNLAVDRIVNTWYFQGPTGDETDTMRENVFDRLVAFYTAIQGMFSRTITGGVTLQMYRLEDPAPRVPIDTRSFTITPATESGFPAEVALVLSFQGTRASGINMQRRKGRVYLGPLTVATAGAISTGQPDVRPSQATIDAFLAAADDVRGTNATTQMLHCIFSERTLQSPGGTLDNSTVEVIEYSMDNAYDTQRRRGAVATTRTKVSVP